MLFSTDSLRSSALHEEFLRRASRIPFLGLGLSVDVYSPDVVDLCGELRRQQIPMAYLEVFHAASEALEMVRARLSDIPMAYHAEGLWVTQPDWETAYNSQERLQATACNLRILQAHWMNHECAAKEIAGFTFGTYLPPVFTEVSAEVTAYQAWNAQLQLDQCDWGQQVHSPLLLLESPPLTYFSMGEVPYAEFFANLTAKSPCGLVLDLGHVWTVYRYSGAWRSQSLKSFFETFLEEFPLERVIQIHIAGLNCHPHILSQVGSGPDQNPPMWIDAHEASIPDDLFMLLDRVVREPRLLNLKGIALEVDNKAIPVICREMKTAMKILEPLVHFSSRVSPPATEFQSEAACQLGNIEPSLETLHLLTHQYTKYLELVRGFMSHRPDVPREWNHEMGEGLRLYTTWYLPFEILSWGGDVRVMFPHSWVLLDHHGISVNRFVEFWFAHPRASASDYDFFLRKIDVFVEFFCQVFPGSDFPVKQEAELLTQDYLFACQGLSR